ncbi:hypothetical protein KLQUMMO235M1_07820 [Klebsiella quasipneumoniae subsp. quasipneumoniae]
MNFKKDFQGSYIKCYFYVTPYFYLTIKNLLCQGIIDKNIQNLLFEGND